MTATYLGKDFNKFLDEIGEIGFVKTVEHPLIYLSGLPKAVPQEVVVFESGQIGQVLSTGEDVVEVLLLSNDFVAMDSKAVRTGMFLQVPVGDKIFGSVQNPLGKSLYEEGTLSVSSEYLKLDRPVLGIKYREKVVEPFETGVTVVDLMVPLGKGQRELVIGDRKTGKTEFLLQTMRCQSLKDTVCIYACVGKKKYDIRQVDDFIRNNDMSRNSMVIATSSLDPVGLIYITPYAAMSVAEYFRDRGRDVLLIIDDLTTHAKFYREISLLGKRFPGRASYPGNIFYTHSRLLERSGNFITENGVRSITCLPVAETVEGDISGYIPTNLMSITDGHIFFDKDLFAQGRRPAVNYFLSVTRVGRQTQSRLRWGINRELTTILSLLEKTQQFVHFGAELSEGVKTTLATGDRILNFFNQPMNEIIPTNVQSIFFVMIWLGLLKTGGEGSSTRYVVSEATKLYRENEQFRNLVEDLIHNASDLNDLLGKMTARSKEILGYLNVTP